MKIEAVIGGKSSRERFWKNSSQCRGIWLQVKQVMASFCCYDNFDVIVTLVPAKFSSLSNTAVAGFPSLALSDSYSWFSHNITKIQTKKLSLLLSFYFHVELQHLKTFIQKNFDSKGFFVLRYTTREFPGFCVTGHLADGQESSYVGLKHYRFWEIENNYYFNLYEFLTAKNSRISRKTQKLDVSVGFRRPYLCPWRGHNEHGVSIQSFINLAETFSRISCIWTIA